MALAAEDVVPNDPRTELLTTRVELDRVQRQLLHAEKMASLDRLSAGVAHEINNPLGGILTYGHLLLEDLPLGHPGRRYAEIIIREATRCREIVRGLLDFARVSRGTAQAEDINDIVDDALELITGQSIFLNIRVQAYYRVGLPRVTVDRNQMMQAFFNIIYNAAQAMEGEGVLEVATGFSPEQGRVFARFSDSGPGIPEEHRTVIFEPFFTTKDVGEGTGLGLAVVRGIVTQHRGDVSVEGAQGEGATFVVSLPSDGVNPFAEEEPDGPTSE